MSLMNRSLLVSIALLFAACIQLPGAPTNGDVLAVGNDKGSVVALQVTPQTGRLKYLSSGLGEADLRAFAEIAPNVDFVTGLSEAQMLERAAEFHAADAHLLSDAFLERATNLRWAQSFSAGVERYLALERLVQNKAVVLTNMKGIHGPVIAEHVMALVLSMCRDLPDYLRAQDRGEWDRSAGSGQRALAGASLLVVGMGGIGTEVARRAHGFDMRVLATVRTAREAPDFVDEFGTAADLDRLLPKADIVVICLPLTSETRGLFDARTLALMKSDAILVNIARGAIVDTAVLVAALEADQLAGACLDVTDPEPLPAGHPLWSRDDVLITPHTAGTAALTGERRDLLFTENLRRFAKGKPLLNVVDKLVGY